MDDNPYAPPRFDELPRLTEDFGPEAGSKISDSEYRAFIGRNADYYLRKWGSGRFADRPSSGFNWAAFFFSGFWMAYRKMYRFFAIFIGIVLGESIVEQWLVARGVMTEQTSVSLDRLGSLVVAIVFGAFANRWYYAHARTQILKVREFDLNDDDYQSALVRRGGTSLFVGLGLTLLILIVAVVCLVAAEMFLFPDAQP
jgi:hypothetical protein